MYVYVTCGVEVVRVVKEVVKIYQGKQAEVLLELLGVMVTVTAGGTGEEADQ